MIKRVAVLGAGVMGAQIAGHLAGCGVEVLLLDVVSPSPHPEIPSTKSQIPNKFQIPNSKFQTCDSEGRGTRDEGRNTLAIQGIDHLKVSRPPAMYDVDDRKLITPGNFEDDMPAVADCDWVVEAVIEKLEIKQKLFAEVEKFIRPGTIISSNTSGILLRKLTEGRSEQFRKNFLITHFFNPVRYLKLVELVSGPETDPAVVKEMASFLEGELGKGVVYAKDTPNFIANRIGVHAVVTAFNMVAEKGWPIEVVDQVMGVPIGRPKSAIFRTADIVGIDTLAHVAKNSGLKLPAFVEEMIRRGWIGEKSGQGFYKKVVNPPSPPFEKGGKGGISTEILVLDSATMEYRPQSKLKTPSLGKARDIDDPAERLRTVALADDEAGRIAWPLVSESITYATEVLGEIADSPMELDKAMRWGFGWELGPFEQLEVLGIEMVVERLKADGRGASVLSRGGAPLKKSTECRVQSTEKKRRVVATNPGADITDLGDGVFACGFHTKMNAIDGDVIAMLNQAIDVVEREGAGLVIGNEGKQFSAGANLMMILMAAEQKAWDEIDKVVRSFQNANQRIRFCKKPVVVAPFGLTLGGGCELSLAAHHIRAAAETYMGLVEVGVGLIPAGGGCKNMVLRMEERMRAKHNPRDNIWFSPEDGGPFPKVDSAFRVIAFAKTSSSAKEARKIGYMRPADGITLDRERLMADAKRDVLKMAGSYQPPAPRDDIRLPGNGGKQALINAIRAVRLRGEATEHDQVIGERLAHVLCGGDRPAIHTASEQHILDLEREVFLSLLGYQKTLERIKYMLLNGRPLRN